MKVTYGMKITCGMFFIMYLMVGCVAAENVQIGPECGIVKTDAGYLSGIHETGIRAYLGIPYAAPPIGDLRWRPPASVKPWEGIRQATEFGSACPQIISGDDNINPVGNMSEDCLYLNVWTPAKSPEEKLPVMVFIHGGAFVRGAGSQPLYNGSALARKGVVVVTLNYRLGAFGFLTHPLLAEESTNNTSGNYGLLDQQAALKWVQNNIGAFGGDPARVTLFGESAGAISVLSHLASPQSKGLYSQAIVESSAILTKGVVLSTFDTRAVAERKGVEFAQSLADTPALTPSCRCAAGAPGIWSMQHRVQHYPHSGIIITSTLHKQLMDGCSQMPLEDIFRQCRQDSVPLIIGTNANEGISFIAGLNMTVPEYEQYIRNYFGKNASKVLAKYPAKTPEKVPHLMARIITDFDFDGSTRVTAGSMANLNQNTYLYRFTYDLPGQPNGAFHGSELPFVFRPSFWKPDPVSSNVSDNMMDLWVRFAKTGNPNGGMNVTWPKYSAEKDQYLNIGAISEVKTGY